MNETLCIIHVGDTMNSKTFTIKYGTNKLKKTTIGKKMIKKAKRSTFLLTTSFITLLLYNEGKHNQKRVLDKI